MASFINFLSSVYTTVRSDPTSNTTTVEDACVSAVNHQKFHLWLLLPSVILTLLMGLTIQRKTLFRNYLDGRPGVIFPMDILSRTNRFSYVAAWGTVAYLAADIVFNQKFAVKIEGKSYLTAGNALLSMIVYGIGYFPLFASLALDSLFGYMVGTAYAWMLFLLTIYKEVECDLEHEARFIYFMRDLPLLLCLGYISVSLPIRTLRAFRRSGFSLNLLKGVEMTSSLRRKKDVLASPEAFYVRKLLAPPPLPPPEPEELKDKIIAGLKIVVATVLYHPLTGFRYSARVLSVMWMGILLLYKTTLEIMVIGLKALQLVEGGIKMTLDDIGWEEKPNEPEENFNTREGYMLLYHMLVLLRGCFIAAMITALILGFVQILHMLSSYRMNLLALYKGDTTHIPHRDQGMKATLLVGTMKYAGYQVGYIAWGFFVHLFILIIIAIGLAAVITLLQNGITQWLVDLIESAWPVIVVSLVVNYGQLLLARFAFLQEGGEQLALENRRVLFVMSFFLFFYNIFIGLFSCLMRIIKSIVIGALFLSRLDNSALPRRFQMMDPGFSAYVGFMHVEAVHSNPIMLVFLRILMKRQTAHVDEKGVYKECKDPSEVDRETCKDITTCCQPTRARVRWYLAYTLFNNPQLQTQRKKYLASMKEIQKRLAEKYNLSNKDAAVLLENMTAMQMEVSDIDSEGNGVAEDSSKPRTSWETARIMMKFSQALQKIKQSSKTSGTDESTVELDDMASNGSRAQDTTSLWTRIRGLKIKGDHDDFSRV